MYYLLQKVFTIDSKNDYNCTQCFIWLIQAKTKLKPAETSINRIFSNLLATRVMWSLRKASVAQELCNRGLPMGDTWQTPVVAQELRKNRLKIRL